MSRTYVVMLHPLSLSIVGLPSSPFCANFSLNSSLAPLKALQTSNDGEIDLPGHADFSLSTFRPGPSSRSIGDRAKTSCLIQLD